ncbi:MAG TPA: hypothetical protein VFJ76_07685 [Solirubrobacterales bacterium]|nr:hypothetical protein [Solirubrobacterales bacterium]
MSPQPLTFNPEHTRVLDKEVRKIDVTHGTVVVTETDNPEVVEAGGTFDGDDTANLTIYSPDGARVAVYYTDEPAPVPDRAELEGEIAQAEKAAEASREQNRPFGVEAAEVKAHEAERRLETFHPEKPKPEAKRSKSTRGDTGGSGGSFESRTVTELRDLAKERGLTVKGKKGKKPVKAEFVKALRKG